MRHVVKLGAELPVDRDDPRCRQCGHLAQRGGLRKHLWTDLGEGEKIQVAELEDEHAEARFVAGEIEEPIDQHRLSRDEIAVFYRTNAHSRVLEDILVRYELPYQVIGGTKFYERAEIKDAIAYLQLLVNPADEVSFSRVINSPRRGIGDTSQGRIRNHANTTGRTIWEVAIEPEAVLGLAAAAIRSISRFTELIEELRAEFESGRYDLLKAWERSGYLDALRAERTIEAEGRIENLEGSLSASLRVRREPRGRGAIGDPAAGGVPPGDFALHRPGRPTPRRVEGHPDDASQRQGPGIRRGLHHRLRGGVFPHSRSLEEGNEEEERALYMCGDHLGAKASLDDPRAQPEDVRAGDRASRPASSRSFLTSWSEREGTEEQAITGWSPRRAGHAAAQPCALVRDRRRRGARQLRRRRAW